MAKKELHSLHFEQSIDLKDFAYEFFKKADETDYEKFISLLDKEIDYADYTEVLFKTALKLMIERVENQPEDYVDTKWEMLPAMKGLLDK